MLKQKCQIGGRTLDDYTAGIILANRYLGKKNKSLKEVLDCC